MSERAVQRMGIKYCYELGKSCAETSRMMQKVLGEDSMGKTQIRMWYNRFKNGRTSFERDPRKKKTSDNIKCVRLAIEKDRRLTIREIESELEVPKPTVRKILNKNLEVAQDNLQKATDGNRIMADTEVKKGRGRPARADKAEKAEKEVVKEKETPKKRGRPAAVEAPPSKEKKVEKKSEKNGDVPAKRGRGRPPKGSKKAKPAAKAASGRGRGRAKASKKSETEESEEEDKEDEEDENNDDTENGADAEEEDESS